VVFGLHTYMGAVHGVHLKYVAASALCATASNHYSHRAVDDAGQAVYFSFEAIAMLLLLYSAIVHAVISALFIARRGEWILGKRPTTGEVPLWSYIIYAPFHLPTWLYTYLHTEHSKRNGVPVASEVAAGWWIGGRYGAELGKRWAATIDLTVEFPEGCRATTDEYLLLACWDGTPPSARSIERAARLAAEASTRGDVMVHCAHGRGRSTCVMVACLVRAGLYENWREAFAAVSKRRRGVKLNGKMMRALDEWERLAK